MNRRYIVRRSAAMVTAVLAGLLFCVDQTVAADAFPSRPIKIVVPFPPGGPADMVARVYAEELQRVLHQPAVVENRAGASGTLGASAVAKSPADGYTLLLTSASTQSVAPATMKAKPYDPVQDFTPIAQITTAPFVLLVHPSVQAKSLPEFLQLMRSKPDSLAYGTAGVGSLIHLAVLQFESTSGTHALPVSYRGGPPVLVDLVSGHLQFAFMDVGSSAAFVKNGRLRALAVAAPRRTASLPDVPTFSELGLTSFAIPGWTGLFAPAGTPREIVDALAKVAQSVTSASTSKQRIADLGMEPSFADGAALRRTVADEFKRTADLVRTAKIEIE